MARGVPYLLLLVENAGLSSTQLTLSKRPFWGESRNSVSSSVGIHKEIYLITVGLTEANVATVLAGWLSLMNWTTNSTG